ncbi:MAG TPA: FAD-dependent oxidoreductase [Bacteroidia bacterium]|jgi:2-polyprenyl-6-methoxyphenol hydroxylase-like FAD-dependent oxidoreductase|nr:FAD-dependent oxidoreductase [Bacteroidia bacterium]
MKDKIIKTTCCISGGGPAGIMLGFILARAGIETMVLEKWPDFFRDFRGDTIHPSVMEILNELGLLKEFLKLPHNKVERIEGDIGNEKVIIGDFTHLKTPCPYIALIPQWDFLNFIATKAKKYPAFHLLMETEAIDIIKDGKKITGVKAKNNEGHFEIHSSLVIAADGRSSTIREKSGLKKISSGAPMDVLWFSISRKETDSATVFGKVDLGRILIMLNRNDYWQCGYLIRKGDFEKIKNAGLNLFHADIVEIMPMLADRIGEIKEWEQVKLLTVTVDHLPTWHKDGLLCIGDAAHAMSPIGGVGINLAIQDAVAAANILVPACLNNSVEQNTLAKVQKRRMLPVRLIQRVQVFIQNNVIHRLLGKPGHITLPLPLKILKRFPVLTRIPGYLVGIGFRPEHIKTPDVLKTHSK